MKFDNKIYQMYPGFMQKRETRSSCAFQTRQRPLAAAVFTSAVGGNAWPSRAHRSQGQGKSIPQGIVYANVARGDCSKVDI